MAERYHDQQQEMIVAWLEARLLSTGQVSTTDATKLFAMARQNMFKHVKEWQLRSALPKYDGSVKCFVLSSNDAKSKIFADKKSAARYTALVESVFRRTADLAEKWD